MKTKKLVSTIMSIMLMSTALIGCKSQKENIDTSSNGKLSGDITVLTHRTDMEDTFAQYKKEFEEKYSGVTVNFESVTDYQNTLTTRMATKDYGDVLMIPANVSKIQYKDFFAPIGNKEELSKNYNYLDNFEDNGIVYGLPTGANGTGFVYNDEVLKKAGITKLPESPEEFIQDLKLIKEKVQDAVPLYTNYVADWALTNWTSGSQIMFSGNTNYMNEMIYNKNEFAPGSPTYTSLKLLYDAVKNKYVEEDPTTSDWERSKQMMADGQIAFMALGSWAVGQIKALSKTPDNIKFMPAPFRKDGKAYISVGPDYGMGVNKNSKNIELSKIFVKWFVERYSQDSNMISPIKGAKLPDFLGGEGIELVEAKTGTPQNTKDLDTVQKESLISLSDGKWVKTIIEIGLGNHKQTFEQYMEDLNSKWAKGVAATGH
jgi:ABC-type glycerol-3-phosphate transport system substrate-binding protein